MADTTEGIIANLLQAGLDSLTLSPSLAVAWSGQTFAPAPDGNGNPVAYLEAQLLPNATITRTINDDGSNRHQGFLQVSVMYPIDKSGIIPAFDIAGLVISHFKKGTVLSGSGVTVRIIQQPFVAPPLPDGDRMRVPVSIPYTAFVPAS